MNDYLQDWLGSDTSDMCALDDSTRDDRARMLAETGYRDIDLLRHDYDRPLSPGYVFGHLYSAIPDDCIPAHRRKDFEHGLRQVLKRCGPDLIEHVPVVTAGGHALLAEPAQGPANRISPYPAPVSVHMLVCAFARTSSPATF